MEKKMLLERWPVGKDGKPDEPVLLELAGDFPAYGGITCSILDAYDIPYLTNRSGPGQIGFLYGGFSAEGVQILVPASKLEEAKEILSAQGDIEDGEMETEEKI